MPVSAHSRDVPRLLRYLQGRVVSFLLADGSRDAMAGRSTTVAQNVALLSVQGHILPCCLMLLLRPSFPTVQVRQLKQILEERGIG